MSGKISKITTPRGDARAMTPLSPTSVSVNFDPSGAGWFGPLAPLKPIAPREVAGRSWDFPVGYNLNSSPRQYEPISFETLRSLADSYDPLRLVIERRKDQMVRLPWKIRKRHDEGKPGRAQVSAATRARIDDVGRLFRRPSHDRTFRSFMRELLEDLFVTDNASIYLRRDGGGNLIGLGNLDGATIKRVIDNWGRTSEPAIAGRSLPAHFEQIGYTEYQGIAYPTTHQQILKGLPAVNYTALDLISKPFNPRPGHAYGLSQVEQVAMTVAIAMRRTSSQLEYYLEGNVPAGIFSLPESWTVDQVAQFQDWWDSLFVGNLGLRRQLRFVSGNGKYQAFAEPPLKAEVDEWLSRIICFAFSYPPSALVALSNRSIAEQHDRTAEEEGLEPLKQWFAEIANEIIELHLGHDDLEFAWIEEDEIDQEKQSEILTRYAESAILTINQVRERLGEEPDPSPAANLLMVKTSTGYVPLAHSEQAQTAYEEAAKIKKGAVTMLAPDDWTPCDRFSLAGTTFVPNLAKRQLLVFSESDVIVLEAAGWLRQPT